MASDEADRRTYMTRTKIEVGEWSDPSMDGDDPAEPDALSVYGDAVFVIGFDFDPSGSIESSSCSVDGRMGIGPDGRHFSIAPSLLAATIGQICAAASMDGKVHPQMRQALNIAAKSIIRTHESISNSKSERPQDLPN